MMNTHLLHALPARRAVAANWCASAWPSAPAGAFASAR